MTPNEALRKRLRRLLHEEDDTRFADEDLDVLLSESNTVYGAAALGWAEKAAMIQAEMGDVESTQTGQERYDFVKLKDRLAYALSLRDMYQKMDDQRQGTGSLFLGIEKPGVL